MHIHSILAATAAGLIAITPASAQVADTHSVAVSTAGLDLTTATGTRQLERRVRGAAREICGAPTSRLLQEVMQVSACMTAVQKGARSQIDARIAAAHSAEKLADLPSTPMGNLQH